MKRYIFMLLGFMLLHNGLLACDICGSGGDNAFGLLPSYRKHFVGLRYQFRNFNINHPSLFANEESIQAKSYYQQADIWGRFGFAKNRLMLYASMPIVFNVQIEEGLKYRAGGMGDAQLILQGLLINSTDSAAYKIRHTLMLGAGIKLPSGKSTLKSHGKELPVGIQPGSGSFDLPLNLLYTLQYRKFGINTELNYRFNTVSKTGYRVGNRFSSGLQLLYRQAWRNNMLLPYLSLQFEHKALDSKNGFPQEFTDGQAFNLGLGTEIFMQKCSFGLSVQRALYQNFGSGYVQSDWQAQARILFLI